MSIEVKRVKRAFTEEFKLEAVELARKNGASKAAKDLGINESSIRGWRKKFDPPLNSQILGNNKKSYAELEKENKRLAKEIGYMKEINKVLKKSTAIFSAEIMGSMK